MSWYRTATKQFCLYLIQMCQWHQIQALQNVQKENPDIQFHPQLTLINVLIMAASNLVIFTALPYDWNHQVASDFYGLELTAGHALLASLVLSSLGSVCEIIPLVRYSHRLQRLCCVKFPIQEVKVLNMESVLGGGKIIDREIGPNLMEITHL